MSPDRSRSRSGGTRGAASRTRERKPAPTTAATQADVWTIKPASAIAHKQWQNAVEVEPDLMAKTRERLLTRPLYRGDNPRRTAQLHGRLATRKIGGTTLPQWQHEITASGRVWYCPDKETRIVWVTQVSLTHPKATE